MSDSPTKAADRYLRTCLLIGVGFALGCTAFALLAIPVLRPGGGSVEFRDLGHIALSAGFAFLFGCGLSLAFASRPFWNTGFGRKLLVLIGARDPLQGRCALGSLTVLGAIGLWVSIPQIIRGRYVRDVMTVRFPLVEVTADQEGLTKQQLYLGSFVVLVLLPVLVGYCVWLRRQYHILQEESPDHDEQETVKGVPDEVIWNVPNLDGIGAELPQIPSQPSQPEQTLPSIPESLYPAHPTDQPVDPGIVN